MRLSAARCRSGSQQRQPAAALRWRWRESGLLACRVARAQLAVLLRCQVHCTNLSPFLSVVGVCAAQAAGGLPDCCVHTHCVFTVCGPRVFICVCRPLFMPRRVLTAARVT
jgi:hypothetical protein